MPQEIILKPEEFEAVVAKMKAKDFSGVDDRLWEGIVQQAVDWWAYTNNMGILQQVVGSIKEIPKLPSEIPQPGDSHPLKYVEFPPQGGVLTHMQGYDHPYKGFPFAEFVDKIDLIKKLSRSTQSGFYHALLKRPWTRWLLVFLVPSARSIFWAYTFTFYRLIERFRLKTERYCDAVREIHRAASVEVEGEDPQITELRHMLRDIECMILEFDNAYRFRVQDLLADLNKENLQKNPVKEINRLLDIWISREKTVEIKDSWRLLKAFVSWYLRFDRKLLKMIVRVLSNIDTEKTKLSVEDKYFADIRKDYEFPLRVDEPTSSNVRP